MGFYNASGIGTGGVWLNPTKSGTSIVWHHPWPLDIIDALVFGEKSRGGAIIHYHLDLSTIVIRESIILVAFPEASIAAHCSGSDNNPTVSWSTR